MTNQPLRIERKNEVVDRTGLPATTLHDRITAGLFPRSIPLGGRTVGWPAHEVDAVIAAMIAGRDNDYIRELVAGLAASRQSLCS